MMQSYPEQPQTRRKRGSFFGVLNQQDTDSIRSDDTETEESENASPLGIKNVRLSRMFGTIPFGVTEEEKEDTKSKSKEQEKGIVRTRSVSVIDNPKPVVEKIVARRKGTSKSITIIKTIDEYGFDIVIEI